MQTDSVFAWFRLHEHLFSPHVLVQTRTLYHPAKSEEHWVPLALAGRTPSHLACFLLCAAEVLYPHPPGLLYSRIQAYE